MINKDFNNIALSLIGNIDLPQEPEAEFNMLSAPTPTSEGICH